MKKSHPIDDAKEINLKEAISAIWRNKILIITITILTTILGYFYGEYATKTYKSEAKIKKNSSNQFKVLTLNSLLDLANSFNDGEDISNLFYIELKDNLTKKNNLIKFLKAQNFEVEENNLNKVKLEITNDRDLNYSFSMIYEKPFEGSKIIEKYIEFTNNNIEIEFIDHFKNLILDKIKIYQKNLIIAEKIFLEYPILKSLEDSKDFVIMNQPLDLFYNGTIVLNENITFLENYLDKINNNSFKLNPVYSEFSSEVLISINQKKLMINLFFFGLIFSLIIVFLKEIYNNN